MGLENLKRWQIEKGRNAMITKLSTALYEEGEPWLFQGIFWFTADSKGKEKQPLWGLQKDMQKKKGHRLKTL